MTLSDLIAKLQELEAEQGSVPVYFVTDDGGGLVDVTWVSVDELAGENAVVLR